MPSEIPSIRALDALRSHRQRSASPAPPNAERSHEVFQNSTINALLEGVYDGSMTYGELRRHGDFGLGTFNALDGEMIAVDGGFYQVKADGIAYPSPTISGRRSRLSCFSVRPSGALLTASLDYEQLQTLVDGLMEGPNLFYAVRVDGHFASVTTRSVPRQQRPYPPLAEVAKTEPVFHLDNVSGTLAGFRFPDFARGLNVPGFHLHFLTEDHRAGGHVLDLVLECGEVAIDASASFHMELPTDPIFLHADLDHDRGDALDRAERGK